MPPLIDLPFMRKGFGQAPGGQKGGEGPQVPQEPAESEDSLRAKLYRLIIDRYRETIEEHETKTISELKLLVQPQHPEISGVKESIEGGFHPYSSHDNLLQAATMAARHVSSFRTISAPVSFWLTFSDMKELMAGDEIDKSILLCSILRSLGSEDARVFVTDAKSSCVLFGFSGQFFVADHRQKGFLPAASLKEAASLMRGKPIYSFNDKEYEDFKDEG